MKRIAWVVSVVALLILAGFMLRRAKSTLPSPPGTSAEASGVTALGPGGSFDIPAVSASELKRRLDAREDFLLVFVGSAQYFEERRIPGATCVAAAEIVGKLSAFRDREIILYCGCCAGASDGVSGLAVRQLLEAGFRRVSHLSGHFAAWQGAGYPCEGTNPAASFEQAYANEEQKSRLDRYQAETTKEREDLARQQKDLDAFDRSKEVEGLRLKRTIAEENGDQAKVAEIDRLLRERGR